MMSECGEAAAPADNNETFDMVQDALPPPAALPAFVQPPPPPPPSTTSDGSAPNPFSIRAAGASRPTVTPAQQPPPVLPPMPQAPSMSPPTDPMIGMSAALPPSATPLSGGVGISMGSAVEEPAGRTSAGDGGRGMMFGWLANSPLLSKVAEKAKDGVNSMMFTLDPQMKEYIHVQGAVEIAIASDDEQKIFGVKEGFARQFQHVHARGLGAPGSAGAALAPQPVGFDNGKKACANRVFYLRQSGLVAPHTPVVAVEHLLVETEADNWVDVACVLLDDPTRQLQLSVFSQATPVPPAAIAFLKSSTPADYAFGASGFAATTDQAVAQAEGVAPREWHERVCGLSRATLLCNASIALARIYGRHLQQLF